MRWRAIWGFLLFAGVCLAGCGNADSPARQAASEMASSTSVASPAGTVGPRPVTPTPFTTATLTSEPTPAQVEAPAPSPTPAPRAEVVLVLLDCLRMFCVPEEMENRVSRVEGTPGIIAAEVLGELHAQLIYDPTRLSEEEAVQAFVSATGMEVEIDR